MQVLLPAGRATDLHSIHEHLTGHFGKIRVVDRPDPVSQLVGSCIDTKTYDWRSWDAFDRLVKRYPSWDAIADAPVADIEAMLEGVAFPEKKASGLRQVLCSVRDHFGQINLDFLASHDVDQALDCLGKIHGVDLENASAILNFSTLRMRTFVVDAHVLRVLQRFGFVGAKADSKATRDHVLAAADGLSADDLFELHWQIKNLGQTTCTHTKAICMSCPISEICQRGPGNLTALKVFSERPELEEKVIRSPLGHGEVDLCLKGGFQHGVLHEVFAVIGHEAAATGFTAGLVSRVVADRHLLWIRQGFSVQEFGDISASGFFEFGLDPARMLLLSVVNASEALRAANDALTCVALGAVVIEIAGRSKALDLTASRRLTLSAAQKCVTPFLLRFCAKPDASTSETRWLVRAAPSFEQEDWSSPVFEAELIRNRRGKTGHWFMEWNCDGRIFQNSTADHGAMVSKTAN